MTETQFRLMVIGRSIGEGYTADETRRILKLAKNSRWLKLAQEFELVCNGAKRKLAEDESAAAKLVRI